MNNVRCLKPAKRGSKRKMDVFHKKFTFLEEILLKFPHVKTFSDKVIRHYSLAYLAVQKWFVGDEPFYVKIWPKRRFPINLLIAPQPITPSKKVQLTRTGSPQHEPSKEPKVNSVRCP